MASKAGTLLKASENLKKWQKRYVELKDAVLSYSAKQGKKVDGVVDLHGIEECEVRAVGKQKHVVVLKGGRDWLWATDSDGDAQAWKGAIDKELAQLSKEHTLTRIPPRADKPKRREVNALEELPEEAKRVVREMGLKREVLETAEGMPVLLNVVGFHARDAFCSQKWPNPWLNAKTDPSGGTQFSTDAQQAGRRWVQQVTERQFEKYYKWGNKLGEGGYGVVFRASLVKDKKAPNAAIKRSQHTEDKQKATNYREIYYLKTLDSDSIVRCNEAYVLPGKGEMWSVLEFMEGGTLTEARQNHTWEEPQIAYIAQHLLSAVAYLHSRQVVHRDIKSANVMFSVQGDVKLIDFGLATNFPEGAQKLKGIVGTSYWIPPEMIRGLTHDAAVDVWSSACCLMELVNGHAPHRQEEGGPANQAARAMFLVGTGNPPPFDDEGKWSAECKDFFAQSFVIEPSKRASAQALASHAWMKKATSRDEIVKMLINIFRGQAMAMF